MKAVELEVLRHDDALVLQGVMTWVSPVQPTTIKLLNTLPEMHIAVTVDIHSTIKLWDCNSSDALATNNLFFPCQTLKSVFTKDAAIVLVSKSQIWNSHTEQITCQFVVQLLSSINLPSCSLCEP